MNRTKLTVLAAIAAFFPVWEMRAVVLDWDAVTWTAGNLSSSYDIDASKPGNDITVTVSGDTGQLVPDNNAPFDMSPCLSQSMTGGLSPAQNALLIYFNLTNTAQAVTLAVNFSAQYTQGVNNVSFTIFDVDFGSSSYQDQLRNIYAVALDGVTHIAATITTSAANSITGTGLSQVVNGDANVANSGAGSNQGNVTISFGSNAIRGFAFTYGSGSNAPADPAAQKIALYDISFTPIPELNPSWTAIISCMAAAGLILRHRANFRK
jgi:hypothetical protein